MTCEGASERARLRSRARMRAREREFRPNETKRWKLISEYAVFSVDCLTVDGLQAPEAAGLYARRQGGPRGGALRRAHTLLAVDVQASQRAQRRIRAGRTERGHAVVIVQLAPRGQIDPLMCFPRPPVFFGVEP